MGWKERAMYFYDTTEPPESGGSCVINQPLHWTSPGKQTVNLNLATFSLLLFLLFRLFIFPIFFFLDLIVVNVNIFLL